MPMIQRFSLNGIMLIAILGSVSVLAYFLPQLSAYGYGYGTCLTTPLDTPSNLDTSNHKKRLQWWLDDYGTVPCDGSIESVYRYKVQIKNMSGRLMASYTVTRSDRFSSPETSLKLDYNKLKRNHQYKFRVQAVGDEGSKTAWSSYDTFISKAAKPGKNKNISFTLGEQNTDNELWDGIVHWKSINQNEAASFLYYKIVVKQIQNEASGIDSWDKTTETIIATTVDDATADALNADQLFRDFYDTTTELPYTEYKYKITVRAYYQHPTDASATVHSEAVRNYFGIVNNAITKRPAFSE